MATVNDERIHLRHGRFERIGFPAGYISWLSEDDEVFLAAEIRQPNAIRVYGWSEDEHRILTLLTIALSVWERVD